MLDKVKPLTYGEALNKYNMCAEIMGTSKKKEGDTIYLNELARIETDVINKLFGVDFRHLVEPEYGNLVGWRVP